MIAALLLPALGPSGWTLPACAQDRLPPDSSLVVASTRDSLPAFADLMPSTADGPASPERLALDALGRLFVLDRGRGRIYRADEAGGWLEFGAGEQGGARMSRIEDLFARSGPDLYALDGEAGLFYRFDLEGRLRAAIDWRSAGPELGAAPPTDFAITSSGELLLLERAGGRLWWIDRRGRLITDLAGGIGGDLHPRAPTGLGLDAAGTIFVLDPPGARILRFTRQGDALPPGDTAPDSARTRSTRCWRCDPMERSSSFLAGVSGCVGSVPKGGCSASGASPSDGIR